MRVLTTAALALSLVAGAAAAQTAAQTTGAAHGNAALKNPAVKTGLTPTRGANSFTEGQARKRIGKAGYTKVSHLTKTADGLWSGTAMKGGQRVNVALDFKGAVTAQ